jgi:type IV secretion system protein VirB9
VKLRVALLLTLLAVPAHADVTPRPGPGDPHVQSVEYDPEQVVSLRVASGFAVTIEFSPDERIENVAVGNSAEWQATPNRRADHLFIKPVAGAAATNMTVITDVRRYNFNLIPAYGPEADLPFSVRFTYPGIDRAPDIAVEPVTTRYKLSGNKALWPTAMSDDGQFTAIVWAPGTTMPAVYLINERGKEAIVNGTVRDGAYMIEGVASRYVFRLGKDSASARRLIDKARQ